MNLNEMSPVLRVKITLLLLLCVTSLVHTTVSRDLENTSRPLSRHTRYLVYPPRGFMKLVLGLAIPFDVHVKGKYLAWTMNFQFQYQLPANITQLKLPPEFPGRSLRAIDRPAAYATLEDYMQGRGLHGQACMLRSICEAAAYPLHHNGLLGQLLQILLTPRVGRESSPECLQREYEEAQLLGEGGVDCRAAFPACPLSVLDLVSQMHP